MPGNSFRGALAVKSLGFTNGTALTDYYYIARVTAPYTDVIAAGSQADNFIGSTNAGAVYTNVFNKTMVYQSAQAWQALQLFSPAAHAGADGYLYVVGGSGVVKQTASTVTWAYKYTLYGDSGNTSSISVTSSGDVYTLTRGYESSTTYLRSVLRKTNSSGTIQYARQFTPTGENEDDPSGLCVSGSYISFSGALLSGNTEAYVALYDTSFSSVFVKKVNTNGYATSGLNRYTTCDSSGNVYFAYSTGNNFRVVKFDSSGTVLWNKNYSNVGNGPRVALYEHLGYLWMFTAANGATNFYLTKISIGDGSIAVSRSVSQSSASYGQLFLNVTGASVVATVSDLGLVLRVPTDGSGTGTYVVGGTTVTYGTATASVTTVSDTFSNTSLSSTSVSPSRASLTTDTTTSLTIAVTQV